MISQRVSAVQICFLLALFLLFATVAVEPADAKDGETNPFALLLVAVLQKSSPTEKVLTWSENESLDLLIKSVRLPPSQLQGISLLGYASPNDGKASTLASNQDEWYLDAVPLSFGVSSNDANQWSVRVQRPEVDSVDSVWLARATHFRLALHLHDVRQGHDVVALIETPLFASSSQKWLSRMALEGKTIPGAYPSEMLVPSSGVIGIARAFHVNAHKEMLQWQTQCIRQLVTRPRRFTDAQRALSDIPPVLFLSSPPWQTPSGPTWPQFGIYDRLIAKAYAIAYAEMKRRALTYLPVPLMLILPAIFYRIATSSSRAQTEQERTLAMEALQERLGLSGPFSSTLWRNLLPKVMNKVVSRGETPSLSDYMHTVQEVVSKDATLQEAFQTYRSGWLEKLPHYQSLFHLVRRTPSTPDAPSSAKAIVPRVCFALVAVLLFA